MHARLINNDCRGAVNGILQAFFRGVWISSPEATDRASDKIYQLAVALENGFRVPETLIAQSQAEVAAFCQALRRSSNSQTDRGCERAHPADTACRRCVEIRQTLI